MTPSLVIGAVVVLIAVDALFAAWRRAGRRHRLEAGLRESWGKPKTEVPGGEAPGILHRVAREEGGNSIDDQTWSDLDLDLVFAALDRTTCALGREVLYHRLRTPSHATDDLGRFEATVERLRGDVAARLSVQLPLATLVAPTGSSAWQLALEPVSPQPNWILVFPALTLALVVLLAGSVFAPRLLIVALLAVVLGLLLRSRVSWQFAERVGPFRGAGGMLGAARHVAAVAPADEHATQILRQRLPTTSRLALIAGWIGRDSLRGDVAGLLWEYINVLFGIDGTAVWLGTREVQRHQRALRDVAEALGGLDAALAIASVRDGTPAWTRPVFVGPDAPIVVVDLCHPLVADCVPNSLTFGPPAGILLTGANMTGKSTFLRTLGTNAVMAQSLNTVLGTRYESPRLRVRTCMNPADDLRAGKSLYRAEVEIVVALMNDAERDGTTLCLFDELFRGTNAIDRISACEAVLRYLVGEHAVDGIGTRRIVVAATHDLELVALLDGRYAAFHFGDAMTEHGPQFDFRLHAGPATSRNAIALLGFLGAPPEVVADALARAQERSARA